MLSGHFGFSGPISFVHIIIPEYYAICKNNKINNTYNNNNNNNNNNNKVQISAKFECNKFSTTNF